LIECYEEEVEEPIIEVPKKVEPTPKVEKKDEKKTD
jgi:hypothetical protein